ncbi:glycosyltransferase [Pontibacter sp. 172403-2]|uniref:glycosyltransferase family 2 protein n=1 Tax=Pontibacter rufus TaxID=2791028 RepID=UPI0018AF8747|nr:glycosyltransferase [Pontibacter sp. 172403-2]MBF9253840.1 glycosyltransferase [Pontibacter sp. 172403-2]
MEPLVSIVSLTYNHEPFIRKALDGFIMQKTDFPFEVVIHDDASTDRTQEIIKEYEKEYPDIIKPIYQSVNQKSIGDGIVTRTAFAAAHGKYIALCEGDDFWTYERKLQEQIDFLEANPEYVMSFHDALVIHQNKEDKTETFRERFEQLQQRTTFNHKDVVNGWFMPTASMVYRNDLFDKWPDWFYKVYSGDYTLQLMISQHGLIKFHDNIWCTHLKHEGGVSQRTDLDSYRLNKRIYQLRKYIKHFDKEHRYGFSLTLLHLYRIKLKSKTNFYESINTRTHIVLLRIAIQPFYYCQQFSVSELKARILNNFQK